MLLSDLSVKRPVLAAVISLLVIAFGIIAFMKLPLRQYPDINPPVVSVDTNFPGASAAIIESKITQLVEDRISGIEGIKYIESSSVDGRSTVTIEFTLNRDVDAAANDVRDRVSRMIDELPDEADPPEVSKVDSNTDVILWLSLSSNRMNGLELTDYADRYLVDRFAVLDGVARVRIGGERRYAMRIWLDRKAMAARNLTVTDVERVLREENVELPAGRVESVDREFTVRVERSYRSAADFASLVLKRGDEGALVRLGEVAQVELGAESDRNVLLGDGQAMVGLGIIKQSRANTLEVARSARAEMEKINHTLPEGTTLEVRVDTSMFIEDSIHEVYVTLGISMTVVIFVIYLFLGNLRAMLIPAVTVPVSLIGSFLILFLTGCSINLLTLLALVLAIGLVVDDAIIVLENVYRRIEGGEPPLLAAYRGTQQVGFAVLATTIVLVVVFIPITFLEGNVGRLFSEFAIAMAAAVGFSCLAALSLSPMMCSKLLQSGQGHQKSRFNIFLDRFFERLEERYGRALTYSLRHQKWIMAGLAGLFAVVALLLVILPSEFAPREDRGMFFVRVLGPQGASFKNTMANMRKVDAILQPLRESGEAVSVLTRIPLSFTASDLVNDGMAVVVLAPWSERSRKVQQIVAELEPKLKAIPGAQIMTVMPQGFGQKSTGQAVQLVIGGSSYEELVKWRDLLMDKFLEYPGVSGLDADYKETKPQLMVLIDQNRAAELGVSLETIGRTLETMLASRRVTTFPDRGEEYDVMLEGRNQDYESPYDFTNIYVRSERTTQLIPLSNLLSFEELAVSPSLNRYNRLRAITFTANVAPGYSLGEVLTHLRDVVQVELPSTAHIDYKGESLEYMSTGQSIYAIFVLALIVVFLVLAAQFESFVHPGIILLTVPLAVAGALLGLFYCGQTLNIYSQIGIIMLVGLAAKNGILIVEFANQLRDKGEDFDTALRQAAALRLRPILMTSATAVVGSLPLLFASGAGEESRMVIGVVVFFGVSFATLMTLFVIPVAYNLLARRTGSPEAVAHEIMTLEKSHAAKH